MTGITKEDLRDVDIIDATELASDGTTTYITDATVVSTTATTKQIVFSGIDLIHDIDEHAEAKDKVTLSGTTGGADGIYTIATIVDSTTITVEETIVDSTGGTADFKHPSGAGKVGLDATGLTNTTADNVQDAISDLDSAIGSGGLSETAHEALDRLTHQINENSYDEVTYTGNNPTNYTVWTNSSKTTKIREEQYTYTGNKVTQVVTIQYDGSGVEKERLTETYTYTGNKIDSITRTKA
ncbi:MAG: hypothetical protein PVI90_00225 [Desulfobacteraceae bacterium]|jgi:hypothetical protein